jgi:hypothetical protein
MPPKIIRRIDDPVNGRTQNLRLAEIRMQNHETRGRRYIRDTCKLNDTIISINEFLGQGSFGAVFAANYMANGNLITNGVVKFIYESRKHYDVNLNELKMGIELNINAPDYSIHNSIVDKCQILMTNNIATDVISPTEDILIIGLERGENHGTVARPITDLSAALNNHRTINHSDITMLEQSMFAMNMFNRAGFFHRDIKPQNMTNVIRNGISMCVPIDYGMTDYIQDEPFLKNKRNPPIDAFLLGLFIKRNLSIRNAAFEIKLNQLLSLYYTILIRLGVTLHNIRECNKRIYDHYRLEVSFREFLKRYSVPRKLTPTEIGLYIDGRTSKYPDIRLPHNITIENLRVSLNSLNRVFYQSPPHASPPHASPPRASPPRTSPPRASPARASPPRALPARALPSPIPMEDTPYRRKRISPRRKRIRSMEEETPPRRKRMRI